TAQLVNAATAHQLWAETYDREISDFFAIQDEVTQRIVATLVAHVAKSEFDRVLRQKPDNLVAYEHVLRANALTRGRPNNPAMIAEAKAHATLGWILWFQNRFNEGVAEFEHAFRLNPNFVDGRYGLILSHVGRAPEAIEYMKRVMRFDPFYPPSYTYWLGKGHYFN